MPIAAPTNFVVTLLIGGDGMFVSCAAPPVGVTNTQIWTSDNGITYNLKANIPAPLSSAILTTPVAENVLWIKMRYMGSEAGAFTAPLQAHGHVFVWCNRVRKNGAAAVISSRATAVNTWYVALYNGGTILAKIKACILITGSATTVSELIESLTTIIFVSPGLDAWSNNLANFELTANGIRDNTVSVTGFLGTGFTGATCWSSVNVIGMSYYAYDATSNGTKLDMGGAGAGFVPAWINFGDFAGTGTYYLGNNGTASLSFAEASPLQAWISSNRTSAASGAVYSYDSVNGFQTQASSGGMSGGALSADGLAAMNTFIGGVNAFALDPLRRYSHFMFHEGFTLAEAQIVGPATQALRVELGGGFR